MYYNYILQLCSKLLFGHWPYSVYLYICTRPLVINFADMPIHILSLSLSLIITYDENTQKQKRGKTQGKCTWNSSPTLMVLQFF